MNLNEVFDVLQREVDEKVRVYELLTEKRDAVQAASKRCQRKLALLHTMSPSDYSSILNDADFTTDMAAVIDALGKLKTAASNVPYYKYFYVWDSCMQDSIYVVLLSACVLNLEFVLLTPTEVAEKINVPFETSDKESSGKRARQVNTLPFFFTPEQYLQAVITVGNELSRLAVNAVTHSTTISSDIDTCLIVPNAVDKFLKELMAGFMTLNLKNDSLRRRFDSLKYDVKKVEDVVYSLSLRKLNSN